MPIKTELPLQDLLDLRHEAIDAMSVEAWGSYFETLMNRSAITPLEFKAWEELPVKDKITAYCFAILAEPNASRQAKTYAERHLENLKDGRYN